LQELQTVTGSDQFLNSGRTDSRVSAWNRQSIAATRALTSFRPGSPNNSIRQTTRAAMSVRSSGSSAFTAASARSISAADTLARKIRSTIPRMQTSPGSALV
jgi:hypothetical protein